MSTLTISQALAQADLLVDRPAIDAAVATIADAIARDYAGEVPVYLTIMHGALPFSGQLALELARADRTCSSTICTPPATAAKPPAASWSGSTAPPLRCSAAG